MLWEVRIVNLSTYTLLVEYRNGRTETKRHVGESAEDAKELCWANLPDADKEWVHAITVLAQGSVQ